MQKLLPLNLMATIILAVSVIIFGSLSDKIGRKRIMLYGSAIIFVGSIPLFYVLGLHAGAYLIPTCFFYSIISASCMVTSYILLAEIFPTNIRFTGYALAYNVAFALLGGTVPLISSFLMTKTNNSLSPSYYVMFLALLSFICCFFIKEEKKNNLDKID